MRVKIWHSNPNRVNSDEQGARLNNRTDMRERTQDETRHDEMRRSLVQIDFFPKSIHLQSHPSTMRHRPLDHFIVARSGEIDTLFCKLVSL